MTDAYDWLALYTTLKLAFITTVILLMLGTPLAWYLSKVKSRFKVLAEAFIALPLVLPPTVLGFYLLLAFSPNTGLGQFLTQTLGLDLAFSFTGILIGSIIYSLPFVVQPLQKAFEQLGEPLLEAGAMLGASKWDQFIHIVMPMTRASFITAASLGFAHTVGEFGVVLMIGGNIPGETRVLSIALFDQVEALNYQAAHALAGSLLLGSVALLSLIYLLNFKENKHVYKVQAKEFGDA